MDQIYHIYIIKQCGHKCPLCCNRLYDIDQLPVVTPEQLRTAHTVCLTGGDPFLVDSLELIRLCQRIRHQYPNIQKLYIYTSGMRFIDISNNHWIRLFDLIDGLDVAPKTQGDWEQFRFLSDFSSRHPVLKRRKLSNRLYLFEEQATYWESIKDEINNRVLSSWQIIGRKWDKTFNTPENEHFVRLPVLF